MLKRIVFSAIVVLAIAGVGIVPKIFLKNVTEKEFIYPKTQVYQKTVEASGILKEIDSREIYLQAPIIADQVPVEIGDFIQKGQLLATVDTNLTKSILENSLSVEMKNPASRLTDSQIESISKGYGIAKEAIVSAMAQQGGKVESVSSSQKNIVPTEILAPISGVITGLNLSTHVLTQTNRPIITISKLNQMKVLLNVDANEVQYVSVGDPVKLTTEAVQDRVYLGKVCKIYPLAEKVQNDGQMKTIVPIEVILTQTDSLIKAGFTVNASIEIHAPEKKMVLPYQAIFQDPDNIEMVYVWQNGRAVPKKIQTGAEMLYAVEIISGLSKTDKVLMTAEELQKNQIVRLKGESCNVRLH